MGNEWGWARMGRRVLGVRDDGVIARHLPIKIALRPVTVALGATPFGLLERRAGSAAALAMLDDFAISMHLANAAALAAGRPLGPVADAAVATPLRRQ